MQIDLGDGQWADIAEPTDLRSADRKAVNRATKLDIDPETEMPILRASTEDDRLDALAIRVVRNWSLPMPVPSEDPKSLDKLTLDQADLLSKGIKPLLDLIDGKVNPNKKDTDPTTDSSS